MQTEASQTLFLSDIADQLEKLRLRFDRAESGEEFARLAAVEGALLNSPLYCPTCGVQLS